jgi:hypothetical protein
MCCELPIFFTVVSECLILTIGSNIFILKNISITTRYKGSLLAKCVRLQQRQPFSTLVQNMNMESANNTRYSEW